MIARPRIASPLAASDQKGILYDLPLPDSRFDDLWASIILAEGIKDRMLAQAVLNFTVRPKVNPAAVPMHGLMAFVGPPGTGKTSAARGLASRIAHTMKGAKFHYLELEPHGLASGQLGRSQQAVREVLGGVVAERAGQGPLVLVLDEVETLAADRQRLSLEANPVDVHRATNAVLAQLDQLAAQHPHLLILATSNYPEAIDRAFMSRTDAIITVDLPGAEACASIIGDTLHGLAKAFPEIGELAEASVLAELGELCLGLDGRRVRKAVVSALAGSKRLALNPASLTAADLRQAFELAKIEEQKGAK